MTTFRDTEMHLSQIPALHLLQALGYRMLTKTDVDIRVLRAMVEWCKSTTARLIRTNV